MLERTDVGYYRRALTGFLAASLLTPRNKAEAKDLVHESLKHLKTAKDLYQHLLDEVDEEDHKDWLSYAQELLDEIQMSQQESESQKESEEVVDDPEAGTGTSRGEEEEEEDKARKRQANETDTASENQTSTVDPIAAFTAEFNKSPAAGSSLQPFPDTATLKKMWDAAVTAKFSTVPQEGFLTTPTPKTETPTIQISPQRSPLL